MLTVHQTITDKLLIALSTAGYVEGFRCLSSRAEGRCGGMLKGSAVYQVGLRDVVVVC